MSAVKYLTVEASPATVEANGWCVTAVGNKTLNFNLLLSALSEGTERLEGTESVTSIINLLICIISKGVRE